MLYIPKECWKRKIGEELNSPGKTKVTGSGGLPNIDDGYFNGIPLGGFGAGTFSHTFRGDFKNWHLNIGKHDGKTLFPCQFGIHENNETFILNDYRPSDGSLSKWNFKKTNGTYHALFPRAYFEYPDLNIILEEFSPIIPHNYQETSFPVAMFNWHIYNPKNIEREISILFSFESYFGCREKIFYQENQFNGLIFDNLHDKKDFSYGQMGVFVENSNLDISYLSSFNGSGDGNELWETFSRDGILRQNAKSDEKSLFIPDSPGAIAVKIKVAPNSDRKITFALVWDFPIVEGNSETKWYKYYTKFFGKDGRSVTKIARKVFNNHERWLLDIQKWQDKVFKINKPDWFKSFLLNELYYLSSGGTIWTIGKVPEKDNKTPVLKQEEHFGMLECFDYPFYETLDVRFYGSFPLVKLWPDIEKVIMKDYIKSISSEDLEKKFYDHPLDQSTSEIKLKGTAPHDLGSPLKNPFIKINAYPHGNINKWKDLNSKFILLIYRYFYFTGKKDTAFLKTAWESVKETILYLKQFDKDNDGLIENENLPDQTYDNWIMSGPSAYCNGLLLCALRAVIEMAKILNEDFSFFQMWFNLGKISLEKKLWNQNYYLFDINHPQIIMADQLCGQWYGDILGLGEIFDNKNTKLALEKIFNNNVMKIQNGNIGAINGINVDGTCLKESEIWKENTQSNEIWTGITMALASHMDLRGLEEEAMKTIQGLYSVIYEKKGYWFRTPEAWDMNGNFRASMYHRAGAIWSFKSLPS